jgi:hypothetical protein
MCKPTHCPRRPREAASANDTKAFLATFIGGRVMDDWGREFVGTRRDHRLERPRVHRQADLDVRAIDGDGETTVITAEAGEGFNRPSHFNSLLDGDHVSRMTIRA